MVNIRYLRLITTIVGFAFLFINCKDVKNNETKSDKITKMITKKGFPFKLTEPDKEIKLDGRLKEISSVTYFNNSTLICIEDENADIYFLDYDKGEIIEHIASYESGDYEGVELVDTDLYILKSSGTLMELRNFKLSNSTEVKHKTALTPNNNTEGLGYDSRTNSLLIACKNEPYLPNSSSEIENVRCVYQFDLSKKKLVDKPFITIYLDSLISKYGIDQFMPSGIAVHPLTGEFYIISAVGNWLIVLDRNNEIVHTEKLAPKLFKQPEGICFSPDGKTLFISNEGKNNNANVLIFNSL